MAAIGGSIESVSFSGREFPCPADAEVQRKIGGWENEVQSNGNGTSRLIKTRVPFSLDGLTIEIDDDRNDQEFVQDLADGEDYFVISVSFASGKVWQGTGTIIGELQYSSQNTTATVNLSGPGKLEQQ